MTVWTPGLEPPGSSAHGIFQARIPERVASFLLQGISLTQASNPRPPASPALQAGKPRIPRIETGKELQDSGIRPVV